MTSPSPAGEHAMPFRCPGCQGTLRAVDAGLTCTTCGSRYAIRDGIVDLRRRRHDYYFNPVPRREMADLVREASTKPWDETVHRFLRHVRKVPAWIDNVAVNGRYGWKVFLELRPGSRFLDFGCGLGNLTHNIAPHVGEVVALDLTVERLQFAQQRFAKFNADDRITLVAAGDGAHLPFPDAHFDTIALSGVLEWIADDASAYANLPSHAARAAKMVASFFGETNPRRTQLRFLKELRRILKPDGQLFVAIENRWSYEYFLGRPDHHSRLRYGSLLPRFAANLYSIALRRRPYRTYTYSFGEFGRLFAAAGFPSQDCLGLSPGYSGLREIVPSYTHRPFAIRTRPDRLAERIKRNPYFVPAFGMAARGTAATPTPLIGRIVDEIAAQTPALGTIELHTCRVTSDERLVFEGTAGENAILLRLPVDAASRALEDHNMRILEAMSKRPAAAGLVPKPLAHGVHQGVAYYLERVANGRSIKNAATVRSSAASEVAGLLMRLHGSAREIVAIEPKDDVYARLVAEPVARLRSAGLAAADCDALEQRIANALATRPWALGPCHGDLTAYNLLVDGGRISGIVDWSHAVERGLPAIDAIRYVEAMQRESEPGGHAGTNLLRLARWDWPCRDETELLTNLYRHLDIDPAAHEGLCCLALAHDIALRLATPARFDTQSIDRDVRAMLSGMAVQP